MIPMFESPYPRLLACVMRLSMRGGARRLLTAISFLVFACAARGQAAESALSQDTPSIQQLVDRGQQTLEQLNRRSARWTFRHEAGAAASIVIDVIHTPERLRLDFTIVSGEQQQPYLTIIQRDNAWYVTEHGGICGKYRPYEAPFKLATAYLSIVRSFPGAFAPVEGLGAEHMRHEKSGDSWIVTYRAALPSQSLAQIERALKEMASLKAARPDEITPELLDAERSMRNLLANGVPVVIDPQSGLIVSNGSPGQAFRMSDFRWIEADANANEFTVDEAKFRDCTGDPTKGERRSLLMIGHNGLWQPGLPAGETDCRLVNLETGDIRRVPFRGLQAMPGCFSIDRRKAYVSGMPCEGGSIGLFEVDLQSGQQRQLGGKALAHGHCMFPALSPDGRSIAVLHGGVAGILQAQLMIVGVDEGAEARPLGPVMDMAGPSWLPDGSGLVFERRDAGADAFVRTSFIARIDINGTVTDLCRGRMPIVMPPHSSDTNADPSTDDDSGGPRILFQDLQDQRWRTCDLSGANTTMFFDGLPKCALLSAGPYPDRIVMMDASGSGGAKPVIIWLTDGRREPLQLGAGLCAWPAWR